MTEKELIKIIGYNIKKYRIIYSKNKEIMTIKKLSKLTNISEKDIFNLENQNSNSNISINNLYKISTVLGIPINNFLEINDDK